MADKSKIEWTSLPGRTGATWNPATGCKETSEGCDNCYAKTFAERWRGTPGHHFEQGFDVRLWPDRLTIPLRWTQPRGIFVNSMSDLFHDQIDWRFIARVFAVMAACPQHIFIVLTKRHGRMRSLLNQDSFIKAAYLYWLLDRNIPGDSRSWPGWPLPNVWLLVSAENQKWADIRIPALLATPAAVRGVSAEPLLGPIGFRPGEWLPPLGGGPRVNLAEPWAEPGPTLDWVIVGGESGPGAREMRPNWARWIVEECQVTGTPVFVKQMGRVLGREFDAGPKGGDWDRWPADLRIREFPRVGEAA